MSARAARVLAGAGSNQGDRAGHLRAGLAALVRHPRIRVHGRSGWWESRYVGPGAEQDPYLNACLDLRTDLAPRRLLEVFQDIERERGRPAGGHMRPRPLDLDILFYGDFVLDEPGLTIPHPRWAERAFVLEPLAELAPDLTPPDSRMTVAGIRAKIRSAGGPWVRRWQGPDWRDGTEPTEG